MNLLKKTIKNNIGLSMIELIVTIAIMAVISVGIGGIVVSSTKSYSAGSAEVGLQQEVQNITNILNNLVIDAISASNEGGSTSVLRIDTIDSYTGKNEYYRIKLNDEGNELIYEKLKTGTSEALEVDGDGNPIIEESYTLSKYVSAFEAVPGVKNGAWDYTVHFNLGFTSKVSGVRTADRVLDTSFTATSRNGESFKNYEKVNDAVIVVESEAVIEPWQTISIPYEILFSGDRTGVTFDAVFAGEASGTTHTFVGDVNAEDKAITITAAPTQSDDIIVTLRVSGPGYTRESVVTVHTRRVNSTRLNTPDITGTYALAGSSYAFKPTIGISGNNGDRFFALPLDDDYVSPYLARVEIEKSYSGTVTVNKRNISDDAVTETIDSGSLIIDYKKDYFDISISSDLQEGDAIIVRLVALHASKGESSSDALNKTSKKYDYTKFVTYDEYELSRGIFPQNDGYQRGNEGDIYFNLNSDAIRLDNVVGKYVDNYLDAHYEELFDLFDSYKIAHGLSFTDPSAESAAFETFKNDMRTQLKSNMSGKVHTGAFYSVGYTELPTDAPDKDNAYYGADGYSWSQFRPLGAIDGNLIQFGYDKSYRLEPDKSYSVEFVDVLYTTGDFELLPGDDVSNNKILWPYYDKLLHTGFGPSSEMYGCGFEFDDSAEKVTKNYHTYAVNFGVAVSQMIFEENTALGIPVDARTVGSPSNPVILGNAGETNITFENAASWPGLGHNMFINRNSSSLYVNRGDGNGWKIVNQYFDSSYYCEEGGFTVQPGDYYFKFQKQSVTSNLNYNAVFMMKSCLTNVPRNYIKDADGVFSTTTYSAGTFNYDYPENVGCVYFKMYDASLIKKLTLHWNDGTDKTEDIALIAKNQSITLPTETMTREGYRFIGWFTGAVGGSALTNNQPAEQYWDLNDIYAHWAPDTVRLDANGGTLNGSNTVNTDNQGKINNIQTTATKSGFAFVGWFTSPEGGDQYYVGNPISVDTLYAHWLKPEYSIAVTYEGQGTQYVWYPAAAYCRKYRITVTNTGNVDLQNITLNVSNDAVYNDINSASMVSHDGTVWEVSLYTPIQKGQTQTFYVNIQRGSIEGK